MSWLSLLYKDLREHTIALMSLGLGFVLVLLIAFQQQATGTFNLSTFQVVRFAVISLIPLIAFIVGNRLVVREYTGGTRKFVEALPISRFVPLLLKYCLGLFYVLLLCGFVVFLAQALAGAEEHITQRYFLLLLMKTLVIGVLIWSVVFFASFTGRARLVVYVVMGVALMYFLRKPSFDETGFPPLALLDRDLFVFEREIIPWHDLIGTLLIALLFVIAGFTIALVNEGSVAEQLGKPITRRDIVAYALLGMGCLTVYSTLQEKWDIETYSLSGEYVVRSETPIVAVSYLEPSNQVYAELIAASLNERLTDLQTSLGLDQLPQIQIALNTELEKTEIEPQLLDGVFVSANYIEYDEFENSLLNAVAFHHLLLSLTNGRWDYESRHWLLDGLARWWAEGGVSASTSINNDELLALAWITKQRLAPGTDALADWQSVTDQHGFEGADAISYMAMLYLESIMGSEVIVKLTADYINEDVGNTTAESIKRFFNQDTVRFKRVTGLSFDSFNDDLLAWIDEQARRPEVQDYIDSIPKISGEMVSVFDSDGSNRLEAEYQALDGYVDGVPGQCVLRHQPAAPYDTESMIYTRDRDKADCRIGATAHSIYSPYAPGDRVYGLLEFESEKFHRPVPIWVGRIHVQ